MKTNTIAGGYSRFLALVLISIILFSGLPLASAGQSSLLQEKAGKVLYTEKRQATAYFAVYNRSITVEDGLEERSTNANPATTRTTPSTPAMRSCTEQKMCIDNYTIGLKKSDCSVEKYYACTGGMTCTNGACGPAPGQTDCSQRHMCIDKYKVGFQSFNCSVTPTGACRQGQICTGGGDCLDDTGPPQCSESRYCVYPNGQPAVYTQDSNCNSKTTLCSNKQICQAGTCVPDPKAPPCNDEYFCSDDYTISHRKGDCSVEVWATTSPSSPIPTIICKNGSWIENPKLTACTEEYFCSDDYTISHKKRDCSVEVWATSTPSSICRNGQWVPNPNPPYCGSTTKICVDSKTSGTRWSDCGVTSKVTCEATCVGNGVCTCNERQYCEGSALIKKYSDCTYDLVICDNGCKQGDGGAQCNPICAEGWVCNGSKREYRGADCNVKQSEYCDGGCSGGQCIKTRTCSPEYYCKDPKTVGYRAADCSVRTVRTCGLGKSCFGGVCAPNNSDDFSDTCTAGRSCKDSAHSGYKNSDCSWSSVEFCPNGCSSGRCASAYEDPPNSGPTSVAITSYSDSIDAGHLGVVRWTIQNSAKETGIYIAYKSDKTDAVNKSVALGGSNYTALFTPKTCFTDTMYVRAYAVGANGETKYSDWKSISTSGYCSSPSVSNGSGSRLTFMVKQLDLTELGFTGLKAVTIGSCLDSGILTIGCGVDLVTFIPLLGEAKLIKLAKTTELLGEINTLAKLSSAGKKIELIVDGSKLTTTGEKIVKVQELGIGTISNLGKASSAIELTFPNLGKWLLKNGESAIVRLKNGGATNEMLENVIKNGGRNLDEVKFVGKDVRTNIRWVEKGTDRWGWIKIWKKHVTGEITGGTRFSVITKDLSETNIKNIIFDTVNDSKGVIKESSSKFCYFSSTIRKGFRVLVVVDKVFVDGISRAEKMGTINTAYPRPQNDLSCND